jgi:hypothetical protein
MADGSGAGAGAGASTAAEMPAISSAGASDSTLQANASTKKLALKFCAGSAGKYPYQLWESIPASVLCSRNLFERFAHYVTHEHKTSRSARNFALSSALAEVRWLYQLVKTQCSETAGCAPFFDTTDWLHYLLQNIERIIVKRSLKSGKDLSTSASPIGRDILIAVSRALVKHGSKESLRRRLLLNLVYQGCGRASEVATLTWDLLAWDYQFRTALFTLTQLKTSKQKLVLLLPGVERYSCIYKCFADAFASGVFEANKRSAATGNNWLFHEFTEEERGSSVAAALSSFLKQLSLNPEENKNKMYEAYRVKELPLEPSSGGLRVGAINDMLPHVAGEHIIAVSGHDFTHVSAMFEYVSGQSVATCVPGA